MLWLMSGPPQFTCWISFVLCTFESLSLLYLFLYLDLYALGHDTWIKLGSLMETKHLSVFIQI